jgi:hypothetical protein
MGVPPAGRTEPFDDPAAWMPLPRRVHDGVSINLGLYLLSDAPYHRLALEQLKAPGTDPLPR